MNKTLQIIANTISIIFHPLLMAFYGLCIVFYLNTYLTMQLTVDAKRALLLSFFSTTFLIPCLLIYLLYKFGFIKSITLHDSKDRSLPYMVTAVIYTIVYYLFLKLHLPSLLYYILLGATIAIVLTLIINYFWKISAHAIGIGGLLGMILGICLRLQINNVYIIIALAMVAGLVSFARLFLEAHSPMQVYVGLLLGFLCEFILINL